MSEKLLICMMGLPRSGKSTVARVLSKLLPAPVVNRDSIRLALHGQRYQSEAEPMVKAVAKIMVGALFAYHDTIIVDETNLKCDTRKYWRGGSWATRFLLVPTSEEVCLARADATNDEEIKPVIESMLAYSEPLHENFELEYEVPENSTLWVAMREAIGADAPG